MFHAAAAGNDALAERISLALRGLPAEWRQVIRWRYGKGCSLAELASRTDFPRGIIRWRISRLCAGSGRLWITKIFQRAGAQGLARGAIHRWRRRGKPGGPSTVRLTFNFQLSTFNFQLPTSNSVSVVK
jgi:hypothetical protein